MSNTYYYVSEAREHLVEVYALLLSPGQPDNIIPPLMKAVEALEAVGPDGMLSRIRGWQDDVLGFIRMSPAQRKRKKFIDAAERLRFLCVVLWYLRWAIEWLEDRQFEGMLVGGRSYRDMTAFAAQSGVYRVDDEAHCREMLPLEPGITDEALPDTDPRQVRYLYWAFYPPAQR